MVEDFAADLHCRCEQVPLEQVPLELGAAETRGTPLMASAAARAGSIPEPSRIHRAPRDVEGTVHALWLQDLESFEAISQNDDARKIFLRMAAMSHAGRLPGFLDEIARDDELDDDTKGQLVELAGDRPFLLAVEDYLRKTDRLH